MIKARVGSVNPDGIHGPYATAVSDEITGTITFSLNPPVWNEAITPTEKTVVMLEVYKTSRGWRASSARLYGPSDEKVEVQTSRHGELQC